MSFVPFSEIIVLKDSSWNIENNKMVETFSKFNVVTLGIANVAESFLNTILERRSFCTNIVFQVILGKSRKIKSTHL